MAKILAAAIGDCIHVIGVRNFLALAKNEGFDTHFLGPRVSIEQLVEAIKESQPDIVGVSYRLTADVCRQLLEELECRLSEESLLDRMYLFGGTLSTGNEARRVGLFEEIFDGTWIRGDIIRFLKGLRGVEDGHREEATHACTLLERIPAMAPLPLIRHHIGLSTVESTVNAVRDLAEAGVLDVVSIAPDQTAQESFFRPEEQAGKASGAGGVPVRTQEDFEAIFEATRRGNYPLCRCYSGTNDVLQWADMLHRTIHNAWCAVPLSWYNQMDRRGPRPLLQSICEAQDVMRWHAERGIPVEVNEAHQWSLRRTSDAVAVAVAYIAAHNAKRMGVTHYVAQYMLNTPAGLSATKDLAKMLAKIELIEQLHDGAFTCFREVRPGLSSFPSDPDAARGQLAFSTILGLCLDPHIVHVVAYTEGQFAAGAMEIIRSARLVRQVIKQYQAGTPFSRTLADPGVQQHKEWLIREAQAVLAGIAELDAMCEDPLVEPKNLVRAIELGILDAPDLQRSGAAPGTIVTAIVDGACVSMDSVTGAQISEEERVGRILKREGVR